MKKTSSVALGFLTVLCVVAVVTAAWLFLGNPVDIPVSSGEEGLIEDIPYDVPTTKVISTTQAPTTTAPETTTLSEDEKIVENFLAEANTYTQTIEVTTTPAGEKPFFHIVTDGTVSDDKSLEGLEGPVKTIGEVVLAAGFRYDKNQKIFYSESETWQRNFGYTPFYDAAAAFTGMYYDTMRLKFNYGGHDWLFQIWKGRYGITTGGEMGVYYKDPGASEDLYACVPDEKTVTMSFALYRGDELYMTRGPEQHWWLTGFKLLEMVDPDELTMHATYFMTDTQMADALEAAIKDLGFIEGINYQRLGLTMTIIWN